MTIAFLELLEARWWSFVETFVLLWYDYIITIKVEVIIFLEVRTMFMNICNGYPTLLLLGTVLEHCGSHSYISHFSSRPMASWTWLNLMWDNTMPHYSFNKLAYMLLMITCNWCRVDDHTSIAPIPGGHVVDSQVYTLNHSNLQRERYSNLFSEDYQHWQVSILKLNSWCWLLHGLLCLQYIRCHG